MSDGPERRHLTANEHLALTNRASHAAVTAVDALTPPEDQRRGKCAECHTSAVVMGLISATATFLGPLTEPDEADVERYIGYLRQQVADVQARRRARRLETMTVPGVH